MGSLNGVCGNVVPAIGLQTEGDSIEVCQKGDALSRSSSPEQASQGRRSPVKEVGRQEDSDGPSRSVTAQTTGGGSKQKACFYGHASSIWQTERLLQEAQTDIAALSMRHHSILAGSSESMGGDTGALSRVHDALIEAKASLFVGSAQHHQLKAENLVEEVTHEEVEARFCKVCRVVSIALKSDSDFLHPRDRALTSVRLGRANAIAFVTVDGSAEVAKAKALDGEEWHGRRITVTEMVASSLEATEGKEAGESRRARTYAQYAKLQGKLESWVRQLETAADKAVEDGIRRLERGDVEGGRRCVQRARHVATHLPHTSYTGALEQVRAGLIDSDRATSATLAEELRSMREKASAEMDRELTKLRSLLVARGELRESLQAQLRERREELERQGREEEGRVVRRFEAGRSAVHARSAAAEQSLLATRIEQLQHRIATAYPALSFSSLETLMQRLEWLLDDAERALREEGPGGKTGLTDAWDNVQTAKGIASSPLLHADVEALLPPLPPEMDHPTLERLHECFEELHVPVHLQPATARLLADIQVLTTRLNNLEGRCKLEFHPYRQEANDAVADCSQQLQQGNVLAANALIKKALVAAGRVPATFHPRDLEMLRRKVEGTIEQDNQQQVRHYRSLQADNAPSADLYLAFDCDMGSESAVPPTSPPELPGRALASLSRLGWRVLYVPSAPTEVRSKSGVPLKGVGLRLVVEAGAVPIDELEMALPPLLAKDVSALLDSERRQDATLPSSYSTAVAANRFQVTLVTPATGVGSVHVDVRVLPRAWTADPHTSHLIADAVFRAVEHSPGLLSSPVLVHACHAPYGTLHPQAPADWEDEVRGKIRQCWAVVVVVTKRFHARAEQEAPSKAAGEAAAAAAIRGPGRVVALVDEELGPPTTWRGMLGKAIGDGSYVMYSSEKGWEAVVEALHSKIVGTGIVPPSKQDRRPRTSAPDWEAAQGEKGQARGRAMGAAAFVSALKHCRPPGPEGAATREEASTPLEHSGRGGSPFMRGLAMSRSHTSK